MKFRTCLLYAALFLAANNVSATESELRLQRTWMPDAHPGSFAIGFPTGLNACFDPVRAIVAYAWTGDFVNLEPTVSGKFPRAVEIDGEIFHRAGEFAGFHFPERNVPPEIQFKGYRIRKSELEFRYEIGDAILFLTFFSEPTKIIQNIKIDSWPSGLVYSPGSANSLEILEGEALTTPQGVTFPAGSTVEFRESYSRQTK